VLDANIGQFARALVAQKGSMERVVSELGIGELPKTEDNITGDTE